MIQTIGWKPKAVTKIEKIAGMCKVIGLVLAGGAGSRLGGVNKGLVKVAGKPLVQWVYDALSPQVDQIFISANENSEEYRDICSSILRDDEKFYRNGPLAGIHSLAQHVEDSDLVQVVTCDLPLLPTDLVSLQHNYLVNNQLDAVYPKDGMRAHYGLLMFKGVFIHRITALLQRDQRRIRDFIAVMRSGALLFEDAQAFTNGNDWQSIDKIAEILKERTC